ncbi:MULTISPECIES: LarC family nickel insertion protein [unclassified Chelatococcus]|uniref:LarC family nickel insertion protein n=1 Tax=unclassified Chelatococcus TaxID=2638111 RepID=UPI001BD0B29B|nr:MULTISPECIES: LarC family nickel insertion protein [unclassified Chelatococcus]MBS7700992.1 LarC family nickel insertion protein [Chelatococcus sp. YT9]MBX3555525.1 LarC family nickel insertion protein [Chelatococcus sp.]
MSEGIAHIHLDAVGGVAGDMFCAALIDTFPELMERVLRDLEAVLPEAAGRPSLTAGTSGAIRVQRFKLQATRPPEAHHHRGHTSSRHGGGADHNHPNGDSEARSDERAAPEHVAIHRHADHGPGSRFTDMVGRIQEADLKPGTAPHAIAILSILAEAEAFIHGVPIDEVHFHEIGDWDSLADVVAAGSIIAALPGTRWSVSALPRGAGLVQTQHGLLPVPAPATARILIGFPFRDDGVAGERVTPTGAAILKHLVAAPDGAATAAGRLVATGTGAGTRDLKVMPNILRALAFGAPVAAETQSPPAQDEVVVMAFDIDDMTGEEIAIAADKLRATAGVRDVVVATASGKKGRLIHTFRLLVEPARREAVAQVCFLETSTLGLRWHHAAREILQRAVVTVEHEGAALPAKEASRPDGSTTIKVESDALAAADGLAARRRLAAGYARRGKP